VVVKLFDCHLKYVANKIHKDEHLPYQICVAKKKWLHYLCAFSKCSKKNYDDIKKHTLLKKHNHVCANNQ